MVAQLERWLGDLTPAQHQAVVAWSADMTPGGGDRLAARTSWQQVLRQVLAQRGDTPAFRQGMRQLFVEPERMRPVEVTKNRRLRREKTCN